MDLSIPVLFTDEAWQRCFAAYMRHLWDMSHSWHSVYDYRSTLKRFFASPSKAPTAYSRDDVERFLHAPSQSRRNKGAEISTAGINLRLAILKSWYAYVLDYTIEGPDGQPVGLLPPHFRAPTRGLSAAKTSLRYHALSEDEVARFFAAIPDDIRGARDTACFLFYALSGRRRQEVVSLKWGDIQATTFVNKNGTMRDGYMYTFKNKGDSQACEKAELPSLVYQSLIRYLERSGRLESIKPTDPLFTAFGPGTSSQSIETVAPLGSHAIGYAFHKYAKRAGLSEKYSIHSFRHSYSLMRRRNGASIEEVMALLKHKSISTTFVYLQTLETPGDEGLAAIESKFAHLLKR